MNFYALNGLIDEKYVLVDIIGDPESGIQAAIMNELGDYVRSDLYTLRLEIGTEVMGLKVRPMAKDQQLVFDVVLGDQSEEKLKRVLGALLKRR